MLDSDLGASVLPDAPPIQAVRAVRPAVLHEHAPPGLSRLPLLRGAVPPDAG